MNNIPYQRLLDQKLESLAGTTPHLLLHSCCAPCSSYVLEYLTHYFEITVLYFNPNISPESEYRERMAEQQRLIEQMPHEHPIHLIEGDYHPEVFFTAVKGMEDLPEGGERCRVCFEMRLREAARWAAALNADYFTTTLTVGPRKNARVLNEIGQQIEKETGIPYLLSDFKKRGGYNRSIELSAQYGLYRQNYCGCIFSKRDSEIKVRGSLQ